MCRRTFECLNVSNLSAGIVSLSCFVHVRNYPAWSVGLLSLICWLLCFCFHSRPLFCSSRSSTWKVFWDFPQPEDDRTGLMTPLGGETENIAEPSFSNFKNLFSEHVTNDTVPNTIPYHAN